MGEEKKDIRREKPPEESIVTGDRQNSTPPERKLENVYYEALTRYSRVSPPDKDKLSELVTKAKGPARTMKQFAEEIGTTPSTLSRIVNKQNRGANSDKLIADIAAHADSESGVTFEQLMEAHGMAEKRSRVRPGRIFAEESRKIIINELYSRKYSIVDAGDYERLPRQISLFSDYSLRTDALHEGESVWGFEAVYVEENPKYRVPPGIMNVDRRLMQTMTSYYIGDCPYDKVSIVISSRQVFDLMKQRMLNRLGEGKIKDDISIILLDMKEGCFVEEFVIPNERNDNAEVFFPIEKRLPEEGNDGEQDVKEFFEQQSLFSWPY